MRQLHAEIVILRALAYAIDLRRHEQMISKHIHLVTHYTISYSLEQEQRQSLSVV